MPRDTFISWKWFALFLLFPGLLVVAIVFFPLPLAVLFWLYYRGKRQTRFGESSTKE
ncbi:MULTISPECIES: hypothetical protein [unclassified Haladaptatus]|uniref:hypothetical protein n=1 Tax=unclassified Haladaptatus TaxID=2622732 RepID=UPI0023E86E80|nr:MULTISPECIES: hypothetical protein [unclassified Haladaptatus]